MDLAADPALEARSLMKKYHGRWALRDVSFAARPGEIFTLVGPNGSGKTTTVEILEGIRHADGGSFRVLGASASDRAVRASIGVQLQDARAMDGLRPLEVLRLFRSFYPAGLEPEEALERVRLETQRRTLVRELSGGQHKRLLLALAIVNDPQVVFLDEPTTGLDPAVRRDLWDVLRDLRRRGRTVLLTTHYLEEAEVLSDRVAILDRGAVVACDAPGALVAASGLAARLSFTAAGASPEAVRRIASVLPGARVDGSAASASSASLEEDLHRVFEAARAEGAAVRELSVRAPSLEDAFLARTGRSWPTDGEEEA